MKRPPSHKEVLATFDYNPETGIFRWKKRNAQRVKIGSIAGFQMSTGYRGVSLRNMQFLAHRMAWFYMTGRWPRHQIDHIDRVRTNNRFSNLREATMRDQLGNASMRKNNTSGIRGVSRKRNKWQAQLAYRGTYYSLGSFSSKTQAKSVYDNLSIRLRGKFYHSPSPGSVARHSAGSNEIKFKKAS